MEKPLTYMASTIPNPLIQNQRLFSYVVQVDESKSTVSCSCKKFEFDGLICPHVLKVMNYLKIHYILSRYILTRWTKNAKRGSTVYNSRKILRGESSESKTLRFKSLSSKVTKILSEGSRFFETFEVASEKIDTFTDELMLLNQSIENGKNKIDDEGQINKGSNIVEEEIRDDFQSKDPVESQCKGKRKPQRWKPSYEKKPGHQRRCGKCGKLGHYFTTCKEGKDSK
ncbi:hypothetical protein LUZ60_012394 [Juncus effusus]|nr:hypothetical protein LUZ60_012394 [Juncus effusus]